MNQVYRKTGPIVIPLTPGEAYAALRDYFIVKRNPRALTGYGVCKYRTDDGKKCAVGCLIPDEIYNEGLENQTLSNLLNNDLVEIPLAETRKFLKVAQVVHDSADSDSAWRTMLEGLGMAFELADVHGAQLT